VGDRALEMELWSQWNGTEWNGMNPEWNERKNNGIAAELGKESGVQAQLQFF
jgi:hypothetical protein